MPDYYFAFSLFSFFADAFLHFAFSFLSDFFSLFMLLHLILLLISFHYFIISLLFHYYWLFSLLRWYADYHFRRQFDFLSFFSDFARRCWLRLRFFFRRFLLLFRHFIISFILLLSRRHRYFSLLFFSCFSCFFADMITLFFRWSRHALTDCCHYAIISFRFRYAAIIFFDFHAIAFSFRWYWLFIAYWLRLRFLRRRHCFHFLLRRHFRLLFFAATLLRLLIFRRFFASIRYDYYAFFFRQFHLIRYYASDITMLSLHIDFRSSRFHWLLMLRWPPIAGAAFAAVIAFFDDAILADIIAAIFCLSLHFFAAAAAIAAATLFHW